MKRKIIAIDEEKCNGCGRCVEACHEGALQMVDGKARLMSESYCDGLGDCLPECPTGAITIEEREAASYDEAAVERNMRHGEASGQVPVPFHGCPGTMARALERPAASSPPASLPAATSELRQWPCQIKLAPVNAPWFHDSRLLIAADCTAYAHADLHKEFMRGRITLIGCPKLDAGDYAEKLGAILRANEIRDVTVVRMEVPCCGGMVEAVKRALSTCGKMLPWRIVTIATDGRVLES